MRRVTRFMCWAAIVYGVLVSVVSGCVAYWYPELADLAKLAVYAHLAFACIGGISLLLSPAKP